MGEERKSVLSWLSLEEIDNLLSDAELNAGVRNMLKDKKELSFKQIRQEALNSKSPRDAIRAVLRISNQEELGEEMIDLAKISVRILLARAKEHLSTYEVELLAQVLVRIRPDGLGLGNEPWKTMFFENAKKFLPDDVDAMIEEVEKAGIDKSDYISEVVHPVFLRILHGTEIIVLANAIYRHENFLSNIKDFYGINNLDWQEQQRLLEAGDILLKRHFESKKTLTNYQLTRAIEVYRWLRSNDVIEIRDRIVIAEIFQECELGKISKRTRDRRIRRIAKRLKII